MPAKRAKLNFSVHIPPEPKDDDLLFARQLGVECVFTGVKENQMSLEALQNLKQKVDDAGLILHRPCTLLIRRFGNAIKSSSTFRGEMKK